MEQRDYPPRTIYFCEQQREAPILPEQFITEAACVTINHMSMYTHFHVSVKQSEVLGLFEMNQAEGMDEFLFKNPWCKLKQHVVSSLLRWQNRQEDTCVLVPTVETDNCSLLTPS